LAAIHFFKPELRLLLKTLLTSFWLASENPVNAELTDFMVKVVTVKSVGINDAGGS
jgi:hypothetical protein